MASYNSMNSSVSSKEEEVKKVNDGIEDQKDQIDESGNPIRSLTAFKNAENEFGDCFTKNELQILEKLFRMANVTQDGLLNATELKFFLDQHDYVISDQEARQIIKEADFDEDCALSYREFLFLCKRSGINIQDIIRGLSCKNAEILPSGSEVQSPSVDSTEGTLDSFKIRKVFQTIFDAIGFLPSIQETVEFFENKIAEGQVQHTPSLSASPVSSPRIMKKNPCPQTENCSVCTVIHKFPLGGEKVLTNNSEDSEVKIENTVTSGIIAGASVENASPESQSLPDQFKEEHCGDFSNEADKESDIKDPNVLESNESLLDFSVENLQKIYQERLKEQNVSEVNLNFQYDLIVIGGGPGGSAAAKEASRLGKRVAICDFMMPSSIVKSWGWRLGGTCVNVGCVPKMLMHYAGLIGENLDKKVALPFGWAASQDDNVFSNNWSVLIENIQTHIRTLDYEKLFGNTHKKGITYYNAHCEFDGPHKILLTHEDKRKEFITGDKILIAVGSLYRFLDVPGAAGNCITVDDVFSLRSHPGNVLIVGGGPDAIECAGLLCSLNIQVTLMSRSQALKGFDRRMVTLILETLHSRGVKIRIGWTPTEISRKETTENSKGKIFQTLNVKAKHVQTGESSCEEYNTVILAIGKLPCTPLLKLEKAEILVDENTCKIWVDSQDMTTAEDVFAIGDCANDRPEGTPVSYQAGVTLTKRIFEGNPQVMEYDQILPKFLLTPVEYACVGLSEEGAIFEHGEPNVEVYHSKFQPLQFQLANRYKDTYYAKLITLKSENDRIIGLHYLGPNAGEIIQGFTLAIKLKATKSDLDTMISIHPTCAEIFSKMSKISSDELGDETSF